MKDQMTLWLAPEDGASGLVDFLKTRQLSLGVRYIPADDASRYATPVLFTSLGTFQGEQSIRRAALAFT